MRKERESGGPFFFKEGEKGAFFFLLREEIPRGAARIGEFLREKNRGNGEE